MDTTIPLEELWLDPHTIYRRCHDGFMRYKDQLKYVQIDEHARKEWFILTDPSDREHQRGMVITGWEPEHMDINPLPLGYCRVNELNAIYLTRMPVRKQKQLTSPEHLVFNMFPNFRHLNIVSRNHIFTSYFVDMVNNNFPKFKDVTEYLDKSFNLTIPLHRHFAVSQGMKDKPLLLYKNIAIGEFKKDKFILNESHNNSSNIKYIQSKIDIPLAA